MTADPTLLASLASLSNLSAPASNICLDKHCAVEARATALRAECAATTQDISPIGEYCSAYGLNTCVDITPSLAGNFSSFSSFRAGPSSECGDGWLDTCPAGDFATLLGVWSSNGSAETSPQKVQLVDCRIRYGDATIQQNGTGPPTLRRHSFTQSAENITLVGGINSTDAVELMAQNNPAVRVWLWQRFYTAHNAIGISNPYQFAGNISTNASEPVTWQSLLGKYLLVPQNERPWNLTQDPDGVARAIERSFDMATLLAFVREPHSAQLTVTTTQDLWSYDGKVLVILAVPLFATILVLAAAGRVGTDDIVIGYNPLEIARRSDEILPAAWTMVSRNGGAVVSKPADSRGTYAKVCDGVPVGSEKGGVVVSERGGSGSEEDGTGISVPADSQGAYIQVGGEVQRRSTA